MSGSDNRARQPDNPTTEQHVRTEKCLTDWSFFFAALANSDKSRLLWMKTFQMITCLQTKLHTEPQKMVKQTSLLTYSLSIQRKHYRKNQTNYFNYQISTQSDDEAQNKNLYLRARHYLSAICGMMKCCPFLWSKTEDGRYSATSTQVSEAQLVQQLCFAYLVFCHRGKMLTGQ